MLAAGHERRASFYSNTAISSCHDCGLSRRERRDRDGSYNRESGVRLPIFPLLSLTQRRFDRAIVTGSVHALGRFGIAASTCFDVFRGLYRLRVLRERGYADHFVEFVRQIQSLPMWRAIVRFCCSTRNPFQCLSLIKMTNNLNNYHNNEYRNE